MRKQYLLLLILFSISEICFAWAKQGHMIIAEIAYNNLKPQAKSKVDLLFTYLNKIDGPTDFVLASTWADEIKFKNNKLFSKWHYINSPIIRNINRRVKTYPPNIVTKTKELVAVLQNRSSSIYNQAWSLRMLIHLIGDLHQPLHAASLYSKKFRRGDLGGLKYKIRSKYKNLHSYWDQAAGLLKFKNNKDYKRRQLIKNILKENKKYKGYLNISIDKAIDKWHQNSYKIAKNIVYQQPANKKISFQYKNKVQLISKKQLLNAGIHLSQLLNIIY